MDEFREGMPRWQEIEKKVMEIIRDEDFFQGDCHVKEYFLVHAPMCITICQMLALKRGLSEESAIVIGALHDIGEIMEKTREEHAHKGIKHAKKILEDNGKFNDEEIEIIASAVGKHSNKDRKDNEYDELIKDADTLASWMLSKTALEGERLKRLKRVREELGGI